MRQKALVIADAVHDGGVREALGPDVGEAETEAFWTVFLFALKARGLAGVRLCASDAHHRLRNAIARVLGCRWQRCAVEFLSSGRAFLSEPLGRRLGMTLSVPRRENLLDLRPTTISFDDHAVVAEWRRRCGAPPSIASFWPAAHAALAAALAWLIAHRALGHQQPFFAPIAAAIALSTKPSEAQPPDCPDGGRRTTWHRGRGNPVGTMEGYGERWG